jgi:hypothetical protein
VTCAAGRRPSSIVMASSSPSPRTGSGFGQRVVASALARQRGQPLASRAAAVVSYRRHPSPPSLPYGQGRSPERDRVPSPGSPWLALQRAQSPEHSAVAWGRVVKDPDENGDADEQRRDGHTITAVLSLSPRPRPTLATRLQGAAGRSSTAQRQGLIAREWLEEVMREKEQLKLQVRRLQAEAERQQRLHQQARRADAAELAKLRGLLDALGRERKQAQAQHAKDLIAARGGGCPECERATQLRVRATQLRRSSGGHPS